jgi:hypothetical protein
MGVTARAQVPHKRCVMGIPFEKWLVHFRPPAAEPREIVDGFMVASRLARVVNDANGAIGLFCAEKKS